MTTNCSFCSISGSSLKLLAVFSMLIDHIAFVLGREYEIFQDVLCIMGSQEVTPYFLMRLFGRIAFPLFCFLIVEGFENTRNHVKYGRNLFLFALVSEIPWNLVNSGTFSCSSQNVFFTLLLGYLSLCSLKFLQGKLKVIVFLNLVLLSFILRADYGFRGFSFIILLYSLRSNAIIRAFFGSFYLPGGLVAGLAFVPITLYNGQRGFIKGKFMKYFFYWFYPIHLMILHLVKVLG